MKKVAVLLAPGFEEAEAIVTLDILRRLHIDVETLACAESRAVVSYHDIPMVADSTLSERQQALFDAVVLPGGPQGSANLAANPAVIAFVACHDAAGKLICPICEAINMGGVSEVVDLSQVSQQMLAKISAGQAIRI